MKWLVLALALLAATPARADERLFWTGVILTGALDVADAQISLTCIHEFPTRCEERGPIIRPFVQRYGSDKALWGKVAVNGAMLGVLVVGHYLKPEWDRIWTGSVFTMGGVMVVVNISNAATLDKLRKGRQ